MHKITQYLLVVSLICLVSFESKAQRNVQDSIIGTPWISAQYGINWTNGDLADRYGVLHHIGIFAGYKTNHNWIFGVDGAYVFGDNVRVQGLFGQLVDEKGNITDSNGDIATVTTGASGFYVDLDFGKIIPVLSPNKNSGILINIGVGYFAHHIRIDTRDQVIPALELDYRKGYDRLTSGLNTQELIGYSFMANRGIFNFYGGFYMMQGYTYNRRKVFFDQPGVPVSKDMRLDLQYGFKVAWMIPIYKRMPKEYYYN